MANFVYPKALEAYPFPNILADDIKVLLTRGYVPTAATDQFLSDIAALAQVALTGNLGTKTFALGVFAAASTTFGVVGAGAACQGLVLFHDTGVAANSELLCFIDTSYTGLPVTPDGLNSITVTWPAGGIFAI
jgi:hypothetical protein